MNTKASKPGSGKPPTKKPAPQKKPASKSSANTRWIVIGLAAAIVVAGIIAIVAASGGDDSGESAAPGTTGPDGSPATTVELHQTQTVTITGASLPEFNGVQNDPAIGLTAPQVQGKSFDGTPVSIVPGKPTLVVFLAHYCPHCQAEVPRLVDWYENGEVPAGLDVIGVATASSPDYPNYPPSAWLEREDWPFPVMADDDQSSAFYAFGFHGFPAFALLNADGTVAFRYSGEIETDDLTQLINTRLKP